LINAATIELIDRCMLEKYVIRPTNIDTVGRRVTKFIIQCLGRMFINFYNCLAISNVVLAKARVEERLLCCMTFKTISPL
jgi:hypothetical protein